MDWLDWRGTCLSLSPVVAWLMSTHRNQDVPLGEAQHPQSHHMALATLDSCPRPGSRAQNPGTSYRRRSLLERPEGGREAANHVFVGGSKYRCFRPWTIGFREDVYVKEGAKTVGAVSQCMLYMTKGTDQVT